MSIWVIWIGAAPPFVKETGVLALWPTETVPKATVSGVATRVPLAALLTT